MPLRLVLILVALLNEVLVVLVRLGARRCRLRLMMRLGMTAGVMIVLMPKLMVATVGMMRMRILLMSTWMLGDIRA
jgi:hypothetical protein